MKNNKILDGIKYTFYMLKYKAFTDSYTKDIVESYITIMLFIEAELEYSYQPNKEGEVWIPKYIALQNLRTKKQGRILIQILFEVGFYEKMIYKYQNKQQINIQVYEI